MGKITHSGVFMKFGSYNLLQYIFQFLQHMQLFLVLVCLMFDVIIIFSFHAELRDQQYALHF